MVLSPGTWGRVGEGSKALTWLALLSEQQLLVIWSLDYAVFTQVIWKYNLAIKVK
jgi:hypothetical protein